MATRTLDEAAAMTRRELARLHANEMNAALNPFPDRADDAVSDAEKLAAQEAVAALREQHMRELSAWLKERG